ncbi:MAG: tetratricopeptide repeat protein [Planctomycetota bacterium]
MAGPNVHEITSATFQQDVVERSAQTPVLLDFWATWCEPCQTLGPVLEKLADEFAGGFVLGKVDTEKEQDLAYAFGVQGIPFCVLLRDGKPVDGFQGALPEAEVRAFLERHGIAPAANEPEAALADEPAVDPNSPAARIEQARSAAAAGDAAAVEQALTGIPEEDENYDLGQRLHAGLGWFSLSADAAAGDAAVQLLAAREQFLQRNYEGAMDAILESATADRDYEQGLARRAMLLCFAVVGEEDERLDVYRRRLATLLY